MLSNAYVLAKFRFDTAENEPAKKLQNNFLLSKLQKHLQYCMLRVSLTEVAGVDEEEMILEFEDVEASNPELNPLGS